MVAARASAKEDPGRRVLVVDDDPEVRDTLRSLLASRGFAVYTASNGRSALKLLDILRPPPRCVILDLRMPVMDGWEFMTRLRARHVAPMVIVMSSATDPPDGARHYFPKPPPFDALLQAIESCCAGTF
jgi:CheY-like chemotaxis protein